MLWVQGTLLCRLEWGQGSYTCDFEVCPATPLSSCKLISLCPEADIIGTPIPGSTPGPIPAAYPWLHPWIHQSLLMSAFLPGLETWEMKRVPVGYISHLLIIQRVACGHVHTSRGQLCCHVGRRGGSGECGVCCYQTHTHTHTHHTHMSTQPHTRAHTHTPHPPRNTPCTLTDTHYTHIHTYTHTHTEDGLHILKETGQESWYTIHMPHTCTPLSLSPSLSLSPPCFS